MKSCDNHDRDRAAGSSPNFATISQLYGGVYAVGLGPVGIATTIKAHTGTIYGEFSVASAGDAARLCAPIIDEFVEVLDSVGGRAKAGASSMGIRENGKAFDSTRGRWRHHLGAYFKL